MNLLKQ